MIRRLAALVASLAVLIFAASASASELGFNDSWLPGAWRAWHPAGSSDARLYGASTPEDFAAVRASVIRIPYDWTRVNESGLDPKPIIDAARAAGLKVIIDPYDRSKPAAYNQLSGFVQHVKGMARRYPDEPIEILNEPNSGTYGGYTPSQYATVFKRAYAAIRRVNPNQPILASSGFIAPCKPASWWQQVYPRISDLGFTVSAHFYVGSCTANVTDPQQVVRNVLSSIRGVAGNRTIWATEFGMSAGAGYGWPYDEQRQYDVLAGMSDEIVAQGLPVAIVHRMYDRPRDHYATSWDAYWGMKKPDATWRPIMGRISATVVGAGGASP